MNIDTVATETMPPTSCSGPNVVRASPGLVDDAAVGGCGPRASRPENAGFRVGPVQHECGTSAALSASPVLQTFLTKREQYHSNVLTQSYPMFEQATRTRLGTAHTQYFRESRPIDRTDAFAAAPMSP